MSGYKTSSKRLNNRIVLTLSLQAKMDEIDHLRPYMEKVGQQAAISESEGKRLRLAVEEAVANIINYGEATSMILTATISDEEICLTIDDDGKPFDPTIAVTTDLSIPADQRPPGGLGIILLRKLTDRQAYQRTIEGHNILTLIKKR